MKAQHTRGPWQIDPPSSRQDERLYIVSADDSEANGIVCSIYNKHKHRRNIERAQADAALICAAPALLATLMQAVESAGFSLSGPTDTRAAEDGAPAWVCNARAAIADATH